MGIPWWVWFLAAIGGCLLLALITYCLYKVVDLFTSIFLHQLYFAFLSVASSRGDAQKMVLKVNLSSLTGPTTSYIIMQIITVVITGTRHLRCLLTD